MSWNSVTFHQHTTYNTKMHCGQNVEISVLNRWYIKWPLGFKGLSNTISTIWCFPHFSFFVCVIMNISSVAGRRRNGGPYNIRIYSLCRTAQCDWDMIITPYDVMIPTVQFHRYSHRFCWFMLTVVWWWCHEPLATQSVPVVLGLLCHLLHSLATQL